MNNDDSYGIELEEPFHSFMEGESPFAEDQNWPARENTNDAESSHRLLSPKGPRPWKVLIVDDEKEVHSTTRLVLQDFEFEGHGLEFFSAFSGKEAMAIMTANPDTAVVLLDVVMETNHAGLDVARRIREELRNRFVRIILRTGQPGEAPEHKVITEYDINDYKQKTELSSQRLFTTVYTALRSYRDLHRIEKNRQGLNYIIEGSANLFQERSIQNLAKGVLTQVASHFGRQDSIYLSKSSFTASRNQEGGLEIIAATGRYSGLSNLDIDPEALIETEVMEKINRTLQKGASGFIGDDYVGSFPSSSEKVHLLYIEGCGRYTEEEESLLRIFSNNVGIAFDNLYLNQEIMDTQKEIIHCLGEVVESRCKETAHHVARVAEYARILATEIGLPAQTVSLLQSASPMHDIGKIGIPDKILLKPGRLTEAEFEIMKSHAEIGYKILSASNRIVIRA